MKCKRWVTPSAAWQGVDIICLFGSGSSVALGHSVQPSRSRASGWLPAPPKPVVCRGLSAGGGEDQRPSAVRSRRRVLPPPQKDFCLCFGIPVVAAWLSELMNCVSLRRFSRSFIFTLKQCHFLTYFLVIFVWLFNLLIFKFREKLSKLTDLAV